MWHIASKVWIYLDVLLFTPMRCHNFSPVPSNFNVGSFQWPWTNVHCFVSEKDRSHIDLGSAQTHFQKDTVGQQSCMSVWQHKHKKGNNECRRMNSSQSVPSGAHSWIAMEMHINWAIVAVRLELSRVWIILCTQNESPTLVYVQMKCKKAFFKLFNIYGA